MSGSAAKLAASLCCLLLLAGCAWWRGAPPAEDAQLQARIDRLYVRGGGALLANDIDGAIAAWREHVRLAPAHLARARQVRGWLTLLDREAARRFARQAAAREGATAGVATDRLHVALFPFASRGPDAARPPDAAFSRAVIAMIGTDLARVPALTVLEREKIELLVQELKLSDSPLVDPATAAARGRLLGAGTVVVGSVYNAPGPAGPGSGRYRINTAVADVQQGRTLGTQDADGPQGEFFVLQKRVVYGILQALQITDIPPAVHRVHTRSWAAYARFAAGLQLLAEDRFDEARQAFAAALGFDPDFLLAQESLLATPEQGATLEGIRARLRGEP